MVGEDCLSVANGTSIMKIDKRLLYSPLPICYMHLSIYSFIFVIQLGIF